MADLGELVLRLRVDDSQYARDLLKAKLLAEGLKDVTLNIRVDGLRTADKGLKTVEDSTRNVGKSFSALQGIIQGVSQAITQSLIQVSGNLLNIPKNLALGSLNSFQEFDKLINTFQALSGSSKVEIRPLTDQIKQLGQETSKTPVEILKAANELGALGASAEDVAKRLPAVVAASEATGSGLANSAFVIETASTIYGEASDVLADKLTILANTTAATIPDVLQLLQSTGSLPKNLGIDFSELITAFGVLKDAGQPAEVAATGLRTVIAGLNPTSKEGAKALRDLGVDAFDAQGNFIGLEAVLRQFQAAQSSFNTEDFQNKLLKAFGREGIAPITNLIAELDKGFKDGITSQQDFAGAAKKSSEIFRQGYSGAIEFLTGSVETFRLTLGEALSPFGVAVADLAASVVNSLTGSDVFRGLTDSGQRFLDVLNKSPELGEKIGAAFVGAFENIVNTISSVIDQITTNLEQDPSTIFEGITNAATSLSNALVSIVGGLATVTQFIIQNFDAIVVGLKAIGLVIATVFASNIITGLISFGSAIVGLGSSVISILGSIGTAISGVGAAVTALSTGGLAGIAGIITGSFAAIAAAAGPVLIGLAAVAAVVAVVVAAFKAIRSERGQEILGAIAEKAQELFTAFSNSEPVKAFLNLLESIRDLAVALIPVIRNLIGAIVELLGIGLNNLGDAFNRAGISAQGILNVFLALNPIVTTSVALAKALVGAFTKAAEQTAIILDNLTASIQGPKTFKGANTEDDIPFAGIESSGNLDNALKNIQKESKAAADSAQDLADAASNADRIPTRELEAEAKAAADAVAAAEKTAANEKIAREQAFQDEKIARDIAAEEASIARQRAFEDTKRANALALENEIDARKIATEKAIEAIKEEGRIREEKFNAKQQADKSAFEDDLDKRRQAADRQFALDEAGTLDERNKLVAGFAADDRRAAALAPFEREQRDFEAAQLAERKAFEEEKRKLDAEAEKLKADSEADINALTLAAKDQEIELERQFKDQERLADQLFAERERDKERLFNEDQRRLDEDSARRIESIKASNNVDTITARRHGGPVTPGQTYLAGEAGPELLRMGGKNALITKPSLMRFDQPGRIYSAPQTRRKLSQGALSRAGVGGELKAMRKALESAIATPRGGIETNVNVVGVSADQVRRQLARHQLDLYRGLGGI